MPNDYQNIIDYYLKCVKLEQDSEILIPASANQRIRTYLRIQDPNPLLFNSLIDSEDDIALINNISIFHQAQSLGRPNLSWWFGFPLYYFSRQNQIYITPLLFFYTEIDRNSSIRIEKDSMTINRHIIDYGLDLPDENQIIQFLQNIDNSQSLFEYFNQYSNNHNDQPIIHEGGIINRLYYNGIIYSTDRNNYTIGLEKELNDLKNREFKNSSLEILFNQNVNTNCQNNNIEVINVLEINHEQQKAVKSALCNRLTVIQGPPGTGKSQVTASIIINAIYNKKRVLFASKNNKAVRVVDEKLKSIFKTPVLLRVGRKDQDYDLISRLINDLKILLDFNAKNPDHNLTKKKDEINKLKENTQNIRNKLDDYLKTSNEILKLSEIIYKFENYKILFEQISNIKKLKKINLINRKRKLTAKYIRNLEILRKDYYYTDLIDNLDRIEKEILDNSKIFFESFLIESFEELNDDQIKKINEFVRILDDLKNLPDGPGRTNLMNRYYNSFSKINCFLFAWAVTNLSIKSNLPFVENLFDILIIDEASQCDIPSSLPLLYRAKNMVIIGDPNQLRHISQVRYNISQNLYAQTNVNSIYFEYTKNSIFDLVYSKVNNNDIIRLNEHFRSHSDIISFSNEKWYRDELYIHTDLRNLKPPLDNNKIVEWFDINGEIFRPEGHGAINNKEIEKVLDIIKELTNQNNDYSIGVVTPFRHQANKILDRLRNILTTDIFNKYEIIVDTAYGFQGDERDIMIFSLVVSDMPGNQISNTFKYFFKESENQFNVALTRARARLYIVGNKSVCRNYPNELPALNQLVMYYDHLNINEEKAQTECELAIIKGLENAGISVNAQYRVNKYSMDIAIIINDNKKLNIEIDGDSHLDFQKNRLNKDIVRDLYFKSLGWSVMRFWNYEIKDNLSQCIHEVVNWVNN